MYLFIYFTNIQKYLKHQNFFIKNDKFIYAKFALKFTICFLRIPIKQ